MVLGGKGPERYLVPTPFPCAVMSSARPDGSTPHPLWPWTILGGASTTFWENLSQCFTTLTIKNCVRNSDHLIVTPFFSTLCKAPFFLPTNASPAPSCSCIHCSSLGILSKRGLSVSCWQSECSAIWEMPLRLFFHNRKCCLFLWLGQQKKWLLVWIVLVKWRGKLEEYMFLAFCKCRCRHLFGSFFCSWNSCNSLDIFYFFLTLFFWVSLDLLFSFLCSGEEGKE